MIKKLIKNLINEELQEKNKELDEFQTKIHYLENNFNKNFEHIFGDNIYKNGKEYSYGIGTPTHFRLKVEEIIENIVKENLIEIITNEIIKQLNELKINSETFIDTVVERINKKQIK